MAVLTVSSGHLHSLINDILDLSKVEAGKLEYKPTEVPIRDSGIGLKKKDIVKIFQPFEQVDNSSSRRFQGTGLGLSLTKSLVELHGGKIWAESDGEGKGAAFHVVIPNLFNETN